MSEHQIVITFHEDEVEALVEMLKSVDVEGMSTEEHAVVRLKKALRDHNAR